MSAAATYTPDPQEARVAFDHGYSTAKHGLPRRCPYLPGSRASRRWLCGFDIARELFPAQISFLVSSTNPSNRKASA